MDWITGMQRAIDYIEEHLTGEIDYEKVAAESFSSRYHFQRIFSLLSGYTLGEYIRLRRLTLAGAELAMNKEKVIDIAFRYGYDSPDSFAKAFQKFHGVTPSQARADGRALRSFSRLSIKISLEGCSTMQYRIEEKEEMVLTGYKRRFTGIPGNRMEQEKEMYLNTRALQYILKGLSGDAVKDYNIVTNVDDEGYDFYIASRVGAYARDHLQEDAVLGADFAKYYENITVPKGTYAIFETEKCPYPTEISAALRQEIASRWLPDSGYQLSDAPELIVTHWFMGEKHGQRYRELWIPVVKEKETT